MLSVLVVALLMAMASGSEQSDESMEVELPQGRLRGTKMNLSGDRFFYAFTGIPYAEPPVGDLRLEGPVPAKPWDGVREGVKTPICPQNTMEAAFQKRVNIIGEEDCLYLHVYTPKVNSSALLPVMVYIHGGLFLLGLPSPHGGNRLLAKDVILVSILYRLGTLGFMSTGDSVMPGNLGLKDQTLALKWVKENIQIFGGDPKKITIFGQGSGASSVHLHTLSPYSKGLFNRVIMQSGAANCIMTIRDDHAEYAVKIGQALNCTASSSAQLLDCFKKASVEDLVMAPQAYTTPGGWPYRMVPRVDGDFLPAHPAQLLKEGRYHNVDIISGICQHEYASSAAFMLMENTTNGMDHMDDFDAYIPRRIFYHYLGDIEFTYDNVDLSVKLFSDWLGAVCHDEATAMHARDAVYGRHTYRYELQHLGEYSMMDYVYKILNETQRLKNYIINGDDLQYFFDNPWISPAINRSDNVFLSDIMVSLWTNFAKTGNPTPDMSLGFKWEPMTSESDFQFLSLIPAAEMKEDNRKERRDFWKDLPTINNKLMYPDRFKSDTETCHS